MDGFNNAVSVSDVPQVVALQRNRVFGHYGLIVCRYASTTEWIFESTPVIANEGSVSTSPNEYAYPATATLVPFGAGQYARGKSSCAAAAKAYRQTTNNISTVRVKVGLVVRPHRPKACAKTPKYFIHWHRARIPGLPGTRRP